MELTRNTTLVDAVRMWHNGEPVLSVDFGERNYQMQFCLWCICSEQINTTQVILEAIGDERGAFVWRAWASETLQRFPDPRRYPDAPFALTDEEKVQAKMIAYKFMRYGYYNCLNHPDTTMRVIEVRKP